MKLVIVESPTKAKTISKFLSKDFRVESSFGHIRDLPKNTMGIDIEKNFTPLYVIPDENLPRVKTLQSLAKKSKEIYFATDEDREGEAISWHIANILNLDPPLIRRIVFHEITKEAILHALEHPRGLDQRLVDAQQARRIIDRLVGYELSPFLWKKIARGLSAGRVQSVAVRLIVEREREIQQFQKEEYWTIHGMFETERNETFSSELISWNGKPLRKFDLKTKEHADRVTASLANRSFQISDCETKKTSRSPYPPFTTSVLQQDANRKLGFSAKQTMRIAQQLYEQGNITYMRTDSLNLASKFLTDSQRVLEKLFGKKYTVDNGRKWKTKSKLAQEAHEAIRPTDAFLIPETLGTADRNQKKLYELIWRRALASQMPDAIINSMKVDIESDDKNGVFRATGQTIGFNGFLRLYPDSVKETLLPSLAKGQNVIAKQIKGEQHFTQPPSRYSEASLVKALEEQGIGRPSTYAPTISTIQERGYVEKEERKLKPTDIACVVNDLLVNHFPEIVDFKFTAKMEESLDHIASGNTDWIPLVANFYHPFKQNLLKKESQLSKKELTEQTSEEVCEKCEKTMVIKMGRYGKFLACSGYPGCKNTKPLDKNGKAARPSDEKCEKCGKPMEIKHGKYGPFLGCSGYPECKNIKRIEKSLGIACPVCQKGNIIEKRSKMGRIFFSCNQYPSCTYALWSKPTGEHCPECQQLLAFGKQNQIVCVNTDCPNRKK